MSTNAAQKIERLRVDGGATANNLLMQIQANQLQCRIERAEVVESTAFGAALLAGLGAGLFTSLEQVAAMNRVRTNFTPGDFDEAGRDLWMSALERENGR
jgi:glycerol kinase